MKDYLKLNPKWDTANQGQASTYLQTMDLPKNLTVFAVAVVKFCPNPRGGVYDFYEAN